MNNDIVQLTDKNGNNVFPIAGAATQDSISKSMLEEGVFEGPELSPAPSEAYVRTENIVDGAVTSDKIDWTTLEEYSTTERCIGKWVNGKPLYQKVVQTTMPSNIVDTVTSTLQIPFSSAGLSNIDLIFVNELILADGTTQSAWILNNNTYFVRAGAIKSQSYLYTQTNRASLSDVVAYIVVRYTKTTD